MTSDNRSDPAAWIVRFAPLVPAGATVLDLACGAGRHARLFLERGHPVSAVDIDVSGLDDLRGHPLLEIVQADLENAPWPLAGRRFGAVVATTYLWRPLFPMILDAVDGGGVLLYETFARGNESLWAPDQSRVLLQPGELIEAVRGHLQIVAYEHGYLERPRPGVKQRRARLAATSRCAFGPSSVSGTCAPGSWIRGGVSRPVGASWTTTAQTGRAPCRAAPTCWLLSWRACYAAHRIHHEPSGGIVIDLYTWSTPNGRKVSIMLEEIGLPYEVHPINIGKATSSSPSSSPISPNNKIPAIVDRDNGYSDLRIRRDPDLPGREDRQAAAASDHQRAHGRAAVADVPDGRRRPVLRPDPPLQPLRQGEDPLRDRALRQRDQAPLRRHGPAPRRRSRIWPATTTRSPTSRPGPGSSRCQWHGLDDGLTTIRTSSAGTTRSAPARPCSAATTCRPRITRSRPRVSRAGDQPAVHRVQAALRGARARAADVIELADTARTAARRPRRSASRSARSSSRWCSRSTARRSWR